MKKELPSKKLLEKLDEWFETVADYGYREDSEAYQQIKMLIEEKSSMTREFVEKWLEEFLYGAPESYPMIIKAMLEEAGVETEEGK